MAISISDLKVTAGQKVHIKDWRTVVTTYYSSHDQYKDVLADHTASLNKEQHLLYASNSHTLLVIFQAMDAAGTPGIFGNQPHSPPSGPL